MDLSDSMGLAFFTIIITFLVNVIFKFLQDKTDFMNDTKKFKRDFYFRQLTELYLELYAIIGQSEFLRYFHDLKKKGSIKKLPFIETERTKIKSNLVTGEERKTVIEDPITKFNKMSLVQLIIKNKEYASPKLIKLAVAYRYCHENYLRDSLEKEPREKFQVEEVRLIYEIVVTVISETNTKLKYCKMDYIASEMKTGIMQGDVFESDKNLD